MGVCLVLAPVIQRIDIERRGVQGNAVFRVDSVVGDLSQLAEWEEERERLEREREAREAFERKLRDLSRKTSGGDETGAWVQGSDASEEGTPRHPDAMNGKEDRKKRPPPNDFQ